MTLHTWGAFVALGIVVATAVAARRGQRMGLPPRVIWDCAFWVCLAGLGGARFLYVAEYWREFVGEPLSILALWQGGMSAAGALIAGCAVGVWVVRRRGLDPWTVAAAAAPAVLLGDAIGRLGGALSHMYPGIPTTFPISYVLDGVQRHEVGIELALASLAGFGAVMWAEHRWCRGARGSGQWVVGSGHRRFPTAYCLMPTALTLLWYSAERLFLDFLRASDLPISDLRYAGFTLAQYVALVGLSLGLVLLGRRRMVVRPARGGVPAR